MSTLEWKRTTDRFVPVVARTDRGEYVIKARKLRQFHRFTAKWHLSTELGWFSTLDEAKAACQAHWERIKPEDRT